MLKALHISFNYKDRQIDDMYIKKKLEISGITKIVPPTSSPTVGSALKATVSMDKVARLCFDVRGNAQKKNSHRVVFRSVVP